MSAEIESSSILDVAVDLRGIRDVELTHRYAQDLLNELVATAQVSLVSARTGDVLTFERRADERVRIAIAHAPSETVAIRVHSWLFAPSEAAGVCPLCRSEGRTVPGIHSCDCEACTNDSNVLYCSDHLACIDGHLLLYRPGHRPRSKSDPQREAAFWCLGSGCHGAVAWHEEARTVPAHDPYLAYCPGCYARDFPRCSKSLCTEIGVFGCEYTEGGWSQPCGERSCPEHLQSLGIFGRKQPGLNLCQSHRNLANISEEELIDFVLLAVASRRRENRRVRKRDRSARQLAHFPPLWALRHHLIKTCRVDPTPNALLSMIEDRVGSLQGKPFGAAVHELYAKERSRLIDDAMRLNEDLTQGRALMAHLTSILERVGENKLAKGIRFASFRSDQKVLRLRLDRSLALIFQSWKRRGGGRSSLSYHEICRSLGVDDIRFRIDDLNLR
jgi:hypothetical protein